MISLRSLIRVCHVQKKSRIVLTLLQIASTSEISFLNCFKKFNLTDMLCYYKKKLRRRPKVYRRRWCKDKQIYVRQESPPAWTQEAYRPPCSKYSLCCPILADPPPAGPDPPSPSPAGPDPPPSPLAGPDPPRLDLTPAPRLDLTPPRPGWTWPPPPAGPDPPRLAGPDPPCGQTDRQTRVKT